MHVEMVPEEASKWYMRKAATELQAAMNELQAHLGQYAAPTRLGEWPEVYGRLCGKLAGHHRKAMHYIELGRKANDEGKTHDESN